MAIEDDDDGHPYFVIESDLEEVWVEGNIISPDALLDTYHVHVWALVPSTGETVNTDLMSFSAFGDAFNFVTESVAHLFV